MTGISDSILFVTKIDDVQIQLEDFLFAQCMLQINRRKQLQNFPAHGALLGKIEIFRQLQCDGTSAPYDLSSLQILHHCTEIAAQRKAGMLKEQAVLCAQNRIFQADGDFVVGAIGR